MSTNNPQRKKVVVPVQKPQVAARTTPTAAAKKDELIFNKTTYIWMGAGLALIFHRIAADERWKNAESRNLG
jgi:hypothetical protein